MNPVTVRELWGAESCKATCTQATISVMPQKAKIASIVTSDTTNLSMDVAELGPIRKKK